MQKELSMKSWTQIQIWLVYRHVHCILEKIQIQNVCFYSNMNYITLSVNISSMVILFHSIIQKQISATCLAQNTPRVPIMYQQIYSLVFGIVIYVIIFSRQRGWLGWFLGWLFVWFQSWTCNRL